MVKEEEEEYTLPCDEYAKWRFRALELLFRYQTNPCLPPLERSRKV